MIRGATSYKETKFGIIPRSKLLKLEIEGVYKDFKERSTTLKKKWKFFVPKILNFQAIIHLKRWKNLDLSIANLGRN